jgi:hypothetical protein
MKSAAESIIAVGLALKRQKERLPHGMFLPWIEAEFEMSQRTAYSFMAVAENLGDKLATVANLGPKALYELAAPSTPQAVREQVEELIVDGQKVTAADVKRDIEKTLNELEEDMSKFAHIYFDSMNRQQSENKDFENAGEIHRLQIQIETLEKGRDLARKDADTALCAYGITVPHDTKAKPDAIPDRDQGQAVRAPYACQACHVHMPPPQAKVPCMQMRIAKPGVRHV